MKTTENTALLCTISIPSKCVCRCSFGSKMKGNKTEMYHWTLEKKKTAVYDYFFSFFEQYQSEYHCYSKCLALFCLEALDLQGQLSLTPAGQSAGRPVSRSRVGRGSAHRVPLCCGPLGVKRQPHSAALPPGLHLTLPQSRKKKKQLLQD